MCENQKVCWQQACLAQPTPCFEMAGGEPCSADDCLVENAASEIPFLYQDLIEGLCHTVCRMSADTRDNQEFFQRGA